MFVYARYCQTKRESTCSYSIMGRSNDASRTAPPPRWRSLDFYNDIWGSAAVVPSVTAMWKAALSTTVLLYILNQKHLLPRPLSAVVSRALFWPTLPITVGRRLGKWHTKIDETVVMGGAPFGFAGVPEHLYEQYGVRGVINLCAEYKGPQRSYKRLGMHELYLPTTDHFEPSLEDLKEAVKFIQSYKRDNKRVYVHCRAGHGRSAAIVFAWLMSQDPDANLVKLNHELCLLRDVRKTLYKQTNIRKLHAQLNGRKTADDIGADAWDSEF